jgi:hypothetical protein
MSPTFRPTTEFAYARMVSLCAPTLSMDGRSRGRRPSSVRRGRAAFGLEVGMCVHSIHTVGSPLTIESSKNGPERRGVRTFVHSSCAFVASPHPEPDSRPVTPCSLQRFSFPPRYSHDTHQLALCVCRQRLTASSTIHISLFRSFERSFERMNERTFSSLIHTYRSTICMCICDNTNYSNHNYL